MTSPFPYLDVDGFAIRTIMPAEDVAYLEDRAPGFLIARLKVNSSRINGRLGKRYTPFAEPPEIVLGWLVALTNVDAYEKRGWNPADAQSAQIIEARESALAELKEAADGENGLFDLPLRDNEAASAISKGDPLSYAEPSPYDWTTNQLEAVRGR